MDNNDGIRAAVAADLQGLGYESLLRLGRVIDEERGSATKIAEPRIHLAIARRGKAATEANTVGAQAGNGAYLNERLALHNIDDAMRYQPWTRDQQDAGEQVREALTAAAKAILRLVPDGAVYNAQRFLGGKMAEPYGSGQIGFVQRELDRIAVALREAPSPECYERLYAAQQALSWALEPVGFAAPYEVITGTPAAPAGCSGGDRRSSS